MATRTINETRFEHFSTLYTAALAKAVTEHPEAYAYKAADVPVVAGRMLAAVRKGSYNKDGHAFASVCKTLGIKVTYTAIDTWLTGPSA